ncbi:MAG: hypothetical protein ISS48_02735 [Candidatus Aenigmarchaeota archaeon]|nr:hypothetical protein [Candidatus Aenigmarchaeota archaeon]
MPEYKDEEVLEFERQLRELAQKNNLVFKCEQCGSRMDFMISLFCESCPNER